jgi:hypothetical protein
MDHSKDSGPAAGTTIPNNKCHFIFHIPTFSAASDDVINVKNQVEQLSDEVQATEARCF